MSALGQKQTCAPQKAMSASPPIATIKADMVMDALAGRSKASATFVSGTECLPGHAVEDRTSLRSSSPQKRNFPIVDQRLSAKIANFDSIKVVPETDRSSKSGAHAGFFFDLVEKESETGLGGWGARIRTWEWRNQNPLPYHLATPQQVPEGRGEATSCAAAGP
jgi:hypothetical protein